MVGIPSAYRRNASEQINKMSSIPFFALAHHGEQLASLIPDAERNTRPEESHLAVLDAAAEVFTTLLELWPHEADAHNHNTATPRQ